MRSELLRNNFIGLFESKFFFCVSVFLFRFALEVGYFYYLNPVHGYSAFAFEFSILKYCESWLLLVILVVFAPYKFHKPSDFFIVLLLLGTVLPTLSLYGLIDHSRYTVYIVILGYLVILAFRKGPRIQLPLITHSIYFSISVALAGACFVTIWFFVSGAVTNFNLDLKNVYEFRRATGELIHIGLMNYLNNWATKAFGPFIVAYGLLRANYLLALFGVILHVFWFGVTAHKTVLFFPFIILFLWLYFRNSKALSIIPITLLCLISGVLLTYAVFDYGYPASLFIRRAFYVIANNTFDYYTFFDSNEFVYWSNSITERFIEYPYHIGPAELIGEWRGTDSHVNNNFLSTGYMHAGIIGVVFYGVVAGFLFRVIDCLVSPKVPVWFVTALLSVPMRQLLTSADLPTALLTHGLGISMVLAFFARSNSNLKLKILPNRASLRGPSQR